MAAIVPAATALAKGGGGGRSGGGTVSPNDPIIIQSRLGWQGHDLLSVLDNGTGAVLGVFSWQDA